MSRKRPPPEQIIGMLREAEAHMAQGERVGPICRRLEVRSVQIMRGLVDQVGDRLTRLGQSHRTAPSGARPIISA